MPCADAGTDFSALVAHTHSSCVYPWQWQCPKPTLSFTTRTESSTRVLFARRIASDDAIPAAGWGPSMTQYAFNERKATDNTLTFGNNFRLVGWKKRRATVLSDTSDGVQTIRVFIQLYVHIVRPSVVDIFQSVFIPLQLLEFDCLRRL